MIYVFTSYFEKNLPPGSLHINEFITLLANVPAINRWEFIREYTLEYNLFPELRKNHEPNAYQMNGDQLLNYITNRARYYELKSNSTFLQVNSNP